MSFSFDRLRATAYSAAGAVLRRSDDAMRWLSVSSNLCMTVIGGLFAFSFLSWIVGAPGAEVALFFPDASGRPRSELRIVPRAMDPESLAEQLASETLLGSRDPELGTPFAATDRPSAVIYRDDRLFVDLAAATALTPPDRLRSGVAALERSLRLALPGLERVTITVGGREPYAAGLAEGPESVRKTQENN